MNHLKLLLLIVIPFFATSSLCGQQDSTKWIIMYSPSHEANDTRLYAYEDRNLFPNYERKKIGVITHSFSISRRVISKKRINTYVGVGYAKKINRFFRPYDYCFILESGGLCRELFAYVKDYKIDLLQVPIQANFFVLEKLALNLNISPEFSFKKNADGRSAYTGLDFYTLEVNPGISYETNRLFVGLSSRIFQLKKIDRVLFPSFIYGPLMEEPYPEFLETYETYNPFKLSLMIGYKL